mgnify:CR=1 FL=1
MNKNKEEEHEKKEIKRSSSCIIMWFDDGNVRRLWYCRRRRAENTKNNEDKTVIEYWHINSETVGGKTVDELVKEFNESNNEIEVVARYNPEEYKGLMQNLQAETAAGNAPAVVQIGWTYLNYSRVILIMFHHRI